MSKTDFSEQDRKLLKLSSKFSSFIFIGFTLFTIGGMYIIWGAQQLDPQKFPNIDEAFDKPIVQFASFGRPYQDWLDELQTTTPLEEDLISRLKSARDVNIRMALFIMRLLCGSFFLVLGLIFLTTGLISGQYHQLFNRLVSKKRNLSIDDLNAHF